MFICTFSERTGVEPLRIDKLPHKRTSRPVSWINFNISSVYWRKFSAYLPSYSSVPTLTVVFWSKTGSSPFIYSLKIDWVKAKLSSYILSRSKWSQWRATDLSFIAKSGRTFVKAREWAGVSNSGTTATPISRHSWINVRNWSFV